MEDSTVLYCSYNSTVRDTDFFVSSLAFLPSPFTCLRTNAVCCDVLCGVAQAAGCCTVSPKEVEIVFCGELIFIYWVPIIGSVA